MKTNLVEAILIIDRSGSMESIRQVTVDSINEFINAQRHLDGKDVRITVVLFDHEYDVIVTNTSARSVADFTLDTFVPRGTTALYDAIGRTVDSVGQRLASTNESERPEKVLVAIITDGQENASRDYTGDVIRAMITRQQDEYKWDFVFLGADADAILAAKSFGIPDGSTIQFSATADGMTNVNTSLRTYTVDYYSKGSATFSDEDRENAMK